MKRPRHFQTLRGFRAHFFLPGLNMRIYVTAFVILMSTCILSASLLEPVIENVVHRQATILPNGAPGIWKKKTIWKPRWVKEWKSAKVTKPIWKKVWGPVQIQEWVPIPKPPPGWDGNSTPLAPVKPAPNPQVFQFSQTSPGTQDPQGFQFPQGGQDSQNFQFSQTSQGTQAPLWDPVPYPESQQPPPPPAPHSLYSANVHDQSHQATTFNQEVISGIIGHKDSGDYYQTDYSETVNHLTRLPPGSNWRPPLEPFDNHPEVPPYLVPPKFTAFSESDFNLQFTDYNQQQTFHKPNTQTPPVTKWNPLPPSNPPKGHFITKAPDQPYKFQLPEPRNNITGSIRPQGDFIQQAELVSEYHYSDFDLTKKVKPEFIKPQEHAKPTAKPKPPPSIQKPKINPQSSVSAKQRPFKPLGNFTNGHFQVQKVELKEIFPIFNHRFAPRPQNQTQTQKGPTQPPPSPDIRLNPHEPPSSPDTRQIPTQPPPFLPLPETTIAPDTQSTSSKPPQTSAVHYVFSEPLPTTHHNTTESSPTSSFPPTPETTTKSPVFIVTPVNVVKSQRTELI